MTATAVAMEYDQVDHVMCGDSVEENGFARNGVQIISLFVPDENRAIKRYHEFSIHING